MSELYCVFLAWMTLLHINNFVAMLTELVSLLFIVTDLGLFSVIRITGNWWTN